MQNYFFDTEFVEDGSTIMPISMGIVGEDGRELYLEFEFDRAKAEAHPFVSENVLPHLQGQEQYTRKRAVDRILSFVRYKPLMNDSNKPLFWAWYASYDWIVMCQLFGTMMDLPPNFARFVMDLRQVYEEKGRPRHLLPSKPEREHHALADARWNRDVHWSLYQKGLGA